MKTNKFRLLTTWIFLLIICCFQINLYAQTAKEWFERGRRSLANIATLHHKARPTNIDRITCFTKAIELGYEPLYHVYVERGYWNNKAGNYQQALEDYRKVIELEPTYIDAFFHIGDIYYFLKNYQEAIENYRIGINKVSVRYGECIYIYQTYLAYTSIGLAQHHLKKYQEACDTYSKAIICNENYYPAYNNRGTSKDALALYQEAIDDYDKAIALDSNYAIAYNNCGVSKSKLGKYEEAIQDFTKALELRVKLDWITYNNRGYAHFKAGNYKEALADWDTMQRLIPYDCKPQYLYRDEACEKLLGKGEKSHK